jgi:hypothetical protein
MVSMVIFTYGGRSKLSSAFSSNFLPSCEPLDFLNMVFIHLFFEGMLKVVGSNSASGT